MGRSWIVLIAGCNSVLGIGDPGAAPPDASPVSCVVNGFDICANQQPNGPVHFQADVTINTNTDCNSVLFVPTGGSLCVVYGSDIDVAAKVRATGQRPLVLVARGTLTVTGMVDVSSTHSGTNAFTGAGYTGATCVTPTEVSDDGGAAGGSFHGRGGDGGNGMGSANNIELGMSASDPVSSAPTTLRGGCPGARTFGGFGGGAIQLAAGVAISIGATGIVAANGMGGLQGAIFTGGSTGGGGTGGMVELSAPTIEIHGVVVANGGGGGEGLTGKDGSDGGYSAARAAGGTGGAQGDGGAGGAGSTADGADGMTVTGTNAAGGDGGGGAGFILIDTPPSDTSGSVISPSPTNG